MTSCKWPPKSSSANSATQLAHQVTLASTTHTSTKGDGPDVANSFYFYVCMNGNKSGYLLFVYSSEISSDILCLV